MNRQNLFVVKKGYLHKHFMNLIANNAPHFVVTVSRQKRINEGMANGVLEYYKHQNAFYSPISE